MKINRKELMTILGVKTDAMKKIVRLGQLEERLENKGYKLISNKKEGRTTMYEIELLNDSKEILSNICQYMFGTKKVEEFSEYFLYRVMNLDKPLTKEFIAKKVGVYRDTISRWDEYMLQNNILSKDGYFYVAIDYIQDKKELATPEHSLTCIDEYESYNNCIHQIKRFAEMKKKYIDGENVFEECIRRVSAYMYGQIKEYRSIAESKFVYKMKKYDKKYGCKLYKDIFKLIKENYPEKQLNDYWETWL
ncbi:hypothetical protein [Clostridium cibarium]|uniref:Uncharacterized protein n=1 Tax=Clostridium cibarium TaxID=2762247 RepID=A0ABR8PNJ2_9CLOT|nr:hypothetical protein [Clostridium cibarium]MBD7909734.1 hypothetical protein [Clostridium cibarium]